MQVNFDRNLIAVSGEVFTDGAGDTINLAVSLANNLAISKDGDPMKLWDWARKLYSDRRLDLDRSDFQKLKTFVEDLQNVSIQYKAQLLECFTLAPEKSDAIPAGQSITAFSK